MRYRDYDVHIECGGSTLEEYSVQAEDDGRTISCWIPSEAGKVSGTWPASETCD